jgi:hypothetical protein
MSLNRLTPSEGETQRPAIEMRKGIWPRSTSCVLRAMREGTPWSPCSTTLAWMFELAREGDSVGGSLNYDQRAGAVECFWPGDGRFMGTRHLEVARSLAERIFTLER